jgi:D-3-phosphoglycerate dehydrogenase
MKVLVASTMLGELLKSNNQIPEHIELIIPEHGTDEEMVALAHDVEIIICTRLSPDVVKSAPNLKLIQKTGAGVDAIPFEVIPEHVFVANTSGANSVPLAEGTIAMMFALAKHIVQKHNAFPGRYNRRGTELREKKVGIIGLGNIGREIAKRLLAFEMEILAIKRIPSEQLRQELNLTFLGGTKDVDYVVKESDFIILTVALTPQTRGIIGKKQIDLMKPTAYILNVGRAGLIDEEPLYKALKEGKIAGAGLDVWWVPHWWDSTWAPEIDKPSHYPIWELDNVIATPHNVGGTEITKYTYKPLEVMIENIRLISEGMPPTNQVDKEHQY